MFSRPSDSGHTPFGDMYLSHSKDMTYWGKHRHVMAPDRGWESKKIGAGPIPIETSEGCADTCVSMAFCYAEEVVEYVKAHSNKY